MHNSLKTLIRKIEAAQPRDRRRGKEKPTPKAPALADRCVFRQAATRQEKASCCGTVDVFDCPILKREVWESKCRQCPSYLNLGDLKAKARDFKGRIVVIMPALNEGEQVKKTIEQFSKSKAPGTDLVFFVVDDDSQDGCCKGLDKMKNVEVWRTRRHTGQGIARSIAVYRHLEDARAWVSIDSHEEMRTQFGLEELSIVAEITGGPVGCLSGNLTNDKHFHGCGQRWVGGEQGKTFDFGPMRWCWQYRKPVGVVQPVDLLSGACYAFTRKFFEAIGGFSEAFGTYGFFDKDLSIKARFMGIPVMVDTTVDNFHLYRVKRPYDASNMDRWYAYVETFRSLFSDAIWRKHFLPAVDVVQKRNRDPVLEYLLHCEKINAVRDKFAERKAYSDAEIVEWMRLCDSLNADRQAVITCIAAPTPGVENIVLKCLEATGREFPNDLRIAAVDISTPKIDGLLRAAGWQIVTMDKGKPPRMGELLEKAVAMARHCPVCWTIEHDCEVRPGTRATLSGLLAKHPDIGGIEAKSTDRNGKPNYPSTRRRKTEYPDENGLVRGRPLIGLNCTCWRMDALGPASEGLEGTFPATDRFISARVLKNKWDLVIAEQCECVHHVAGARYKLEKALESAAG